jgi:uncharacterized protein
LGEMSGSDLRQTALSFLGMHNVMTLATRGAEGVWAAAIYYVNDQFTFYFLSSPESRHARNLMENPIVAAAVQEDCARWRDIKGVQLEGRASKIGGAEQVSAISLYARKFPVIDRLVEHPAEIVEALGRIAWFKLETTRLFFIDNSIRLGHRDELPV